MKSAVMKRIEVMEQKAVCCPERQIRKLVSKMTTAELRECLDDNTSTERVNSIIKEAERR